MEKTNPTYTINNHTYEAYTAPRVWPYRLRCVELGTDVGFATEERRNDFLQVWRAVEEVVEAIEVK